jgi:hypothetical protein
MYHYNVTKEFPYTVGCFKGTSMQAGPSGNMPGNGGGKSGGQMPQGGSQQQGGNGGGMQGGPPAEALAACSGKQSGTSCQFTDTHGSHSGNCQGPPGMALACAPGR